jgi:para-nitrobenzyl esterase
MKKILLSWFMAGVSALAMAQPTNPYCDGTRYVSEVFQDVDVVSGVQFGSNESNCGIPQNLRMDIYTPQGDTATQRPVIFWGYGGTFITGSRTDGYIVDLCTRYAKRGYVAIGFDYRLFQPCQWPDSTVMLDIVIKAIADLKAAVRYMREHAADYGVDTNYIFAGGASAGAILAANAAYLTPDDNPPAYVLDAINDNGGWEGNSSNNYAYSSSLQGVISLSGALHRATWLDADDGPLYIVHETGDGTVPYGSDYANIGGLLDIITVQGGGAMYHQAVAVGVPNGFISIQSNAHVGYQNDTAVISQTINESTRLFHDHKICNPFNALPDVPAAWGAFRAFPNPTDHWFWIQMEEAPTDRWSVELRNDLGQLVRLHAHCSEPLMAFERGGLPAGVYAVTIRFEDRPVEPLTQRLVLVD